MFNSRDPREDEEDYRRRIRREIESEYRHDGMDTVRFGIKLCLLVLAIIGFLALINPDVQRSLHQVILNLEGCREVQLPLGYTVTKCN